MKVSIPSHVMKEFVMFELPVLIPHQIQILAAFLFLKQVRVRK